MFGMGMPEILLILAIALIVIGPKKLPDLAKSMGRAMREFKKATNELKESMEIDTELGDVKEAFKDMNQDLKESVDLMGSYKKAAEPPAGDPGEKKPATETSKDAPPNAGTPPAEDLTGSQKKAAEPPAGDPGEKKPAADMSEDAPQDADARPAEGSRQDG